MKKINVAVEDLKALSTRHNKLKAIFKAFQAHINDLQKDDILPGIEVTNEDTKTTISFVDREYVLSFSTVITGESGVLKGKVTVLRNLGANNLDLVTEISFNGNKLADAAPPEGENPLFLDERSCCLNLVCNWLLSDVNDVKQPAIIAL